MFNVGLIGKKDVFENLYPLLNKYIQDEFTRNNMINNNELKTKYNNNEMLIRSFITELANHFDDDTIRKYIIECILKAPESLMQSFMKAYLNSNEIAKSNMDVYNYFNKTSMLGPDCTKYLERNGIIVNRTYKDLPKKLVDLEFERIFTNQTFKGISLDKLFESLDYNEKKYIINMINTNNYYLLEEVFNNINIDFKTLINLLCYRNINSNIINKNVQNILSSKGIYLLTYMLFEIDTPIHVIDNIEYLINNKRFELLVDLISKDLIISLNDLTIDELKIDNDLELINSLERRKVLFVKEEAA